MTELGPVLESLLAILDQLEIPYLVGGSVASGSYGLPRQTNDIDIVADFGTADLGEFRNRGNSAETALPRDSSCGRFQVRLFPAAAEGFPQSELRRKRYVVSVIPGLTNINFAIANPEDTILAKLAWFQKGGGISDRQWHDILGVLRIQKASLEHDYLRHWALQLGVEALFDKQKSDLRAAIRSCIAGAAHLLETVGCV